MFFWKVSLPVDGQLQRKQGYLGWWRGVYGYPECLARNEQTLHGSLGVERCLGQGVHRANLRGFERWHWGLKEWCGLDIDANSNLQEWWHICESLGEGQTHLQTAAPDVQCQQLRPKSSCWTWDAWICVRVIFDFTCVHLCSSTRDIEDLITGNFMLFSQLESNWYGRYHGHSTFMIIYIYIYIII